MFRLAQWLEPLTCYTVLGWVVKIRGSSNQLKLPRLILLKWPIVLVDTGLLLVNLKNLCCHLVQFVLVEVLYPSQPNSVLSILFQG